MVGQRLRSLSISLELFPGLRGGRSCTVHFCSTRLAGSTNVSAYSLDDILPKGSLSMGPPLITRLSYTCTAAAPTKGLTPLWESAARDSDRVEYWYGLRETRHGTGRRGAEIHTKQKSNSTTTISISWIYNMILSRPLPTHLCEDQDSGRPCVVSCGNFITGLSGYSRL